MATHRSIVVLSGAGVSAESGISTFRGVNGLWNNHRIEEVASPEGFARDPDLVHRFYNLRRRQLLDPQTRPNAAHLALARLERSFPGEFMLVTQNIDDLHERAGSSRLIHMHGELLKARCGACETVAVRYDDIDSADTCGHCGARRALRPHVVWFGEMPMRLEEIYTALGGCDLFLAVGTSGHVHPAAGFVDVARRAGAATVEVNLETSVTESMFQRRILGAAAAVLPVLVDELLDGTR